MPQRPEFSWLNQSSWRILKKPDGTNTNFSYWFKSFKWVVLNICFAIFPLLLMGIVNMLTKGQEGASQIEHLIYEGGIVLFVAVAIMGAVVVDNLLSGIRVAGIELFSIYLFPLLVAGFISLEFVLICLGKVNRHALALESKKTITLLVVTFLYCLATKSTLYIKEDAKK